MKLERKDIGFGRFQWYVDGIPSQLSEPEIVQLCKARGKEQALWDLWDNRRFFSLDI